jgi:hypothetical protein
MVLAESALRGRGMAGYYLVKPEVAGGLGPNSVVDRSVNPPRVLELHYKVVDWLGDCIVTAFPCFLLIRATARKIEGSGLRGFHVAEALVSEADEFRDINPNGELPDLVWLKVDGTLGVDDFGLTGSGRLVVSERALDALRADGLTVGKYAVWEPGMEDIPQPPRWPPYS